jgi:hypothetical protein
VIIIIQPVDKAAVIVFVHEGAAGDLTSCSGSNGSGRSGLNTRCSLLDENRGGSIIETMEQLWTLMPFLSKQCALGFGIRVALHRFQ